MRFDSSTGRLGIGTTSPSSPLTVAGRVDFQNDLRLRGTDSASNQGVTRFFVDSSNRFHIDTANDGNNNFVIDSVGKVGIGTTNPYATLTVAGNITQTDNSYLISTRKITARGAEGLALYNDGGQGIDIKDNNNVIVTSGNVGIGTTSPSRKLHIYEPLINEPLLIESGDAGAYIEAKDSDTTTTPLFGARGNNFVVRTNGNESMRIDPSGRVGVGVTNPSRTLHVLTTGWDGILSESSTTNGAIIRIKNTQREFELSSRSDSFQIRDITDSDTNRFIINSSGNVGIGTTSPTSPLHVAGNLFVDGSSLKVANNSVTNYYEGDRMNSYGTYYDWRFAGNTKMRITSSGRLGIGTTTPKTTLEVSGDITIQNNNGSNPTDAGSLYFAEAGLTWGTDFYGFRINQQGSSNYLNFQSANLTTVQDVLTLTRDTARVGIGTTSPAGTLHVVGTSGGAGEIYVSDVDNGVGSSDGLLISKSGTNAFIYNRDNGQISFGTNNVSNNLVITNTGNVGIGTTSPSWKLDLNGGTENTLASFSSTDQTAQLRIVDSSNVPFYFGVIGTGAYISPTGATPADGISIRNTGNVGIGVAVPTHKLDVKGDISADEFLQAPSGIPRANLGDPTVTEMALFESQMSCKTDLSDDYTDLSKVTFWQQPNEGDAWSQVTVSDDNKKKFLRTNNSSIVIPNGTYRYRVEFEPKSYRSAQAFYCYHSYRGNYFAVHVWKRRCSDNQWFQHTDSAVEVGKWPGHLYLPMDAIFWHPTDTTSTYRYNLIRIEFIPNWNASNTNNIDLLGGQLWGGYPAGRRTPHTYDYDGNLTLPANLVVNAGRAGIGTTSPAAKLDVVGNIKIGADQNIFSDGSITIGIDYNNNQTDRVFNIVANNSTEVFRVQEDGKVGIGTTSPATKIDVDGTGRITDTVYLSTNTNSKTGIGITSPTEKLDVSGNIRLSGNIVDANTGERIQIGQNDIRAEHKHLAAEFGLWARSSTLSSRYMGIDGSATYMGLFTNNSEKVRIDSTGNVGISTTSPTDLLHIRKDQNAPTQIRVENASNTSNSRASITVGTAGNAITMARYLSNYTTVSSWANRGGILTDSGLTNGFFFRTSAGAISFQPGSNTDSVVFDTSGNVGIGTASPSAKLDVAGDVATTGNITVTKSSASIKVIETGGGDVRMTAGGATGYIGTYNNNSLQLVQNGSVALFVDTSRRVGIGTTSPTTALQVVGRTKTSELHASNGNAIYTNQGSVAVGTSQVDSSAVLNIVSTTKGVLFPRMTETQRDAIEEPTTGLIVYQTDGTEGLYIYKSTGWTQII